MKDKETKNQEKVWNKIALPWKKFRVIFKKMQMPEVINFLKSKKGKILDLGCGSGRHFLKLKGKSIIYGVDFSQKMLKLAEQYAKQQGFNVKTIRAYAYKLPFENNFFDAAIFIATLHCIPHFEKRRKALRELLRVLKPGAEAIISVWSRKQERLKNKPKETTIPWTVEGKKYWRFTYIYDKDELLDLLRDVGFKIKKVIFGENIIVIVKK